MLDDNNETTVLSLGTDTECLDGSKEERGNEGCLLHDFYAEVIARRVLIRFFYQEILDANNVILIKQEKNKFYLSKSVRIYLFRLHLVERQDSYLFRYRDQNLHINL